MTQIFLAAQAAQGGGGMSFIIMMVAIFAIMYFVPSKSVRRRFRTSRIRWPRVLRSSPAVASMALSRRLTWQQASSR